MSGNESRLKAVYEITNGESFSAEATKPLSEIWACNVFGLQQMEEALSKNDRANGRRIRCSDCRCSCSSNESMGY